MGDESQEGGERKKEKELAIVLEANEREQEICWRSACLPACHTAATAATAATTADAATPGWSDRRTQRRLNRDFTLFNTRHSSPIVRPESSIPH